MNTNKLVRLAIFVQARLTSKRFPNKVLSKVNNKYLLFNLLKNLSGVNKYAKVFVLIPLGKDNDRLHKLLKKKYTVFRGKEANVLDRFYQAAKKYNVENIMRVTSDCPLANVTIIRKIIKKFFSNKYDYVSNTVQRTFPHGMDAEIFKFSALHTAWKKSKSKYDKEHVTPYIIRNAKRKFQFKSNKNYSSIRITLDFKEDLILIKKIFKHFHPRINLKMSEIIRLSQDFPHWFKINKKHNKF